MERPEYIEVVERWTRERGIWKIGDGLNFLLHSQYENPNSICFASLGEQARASFPALRSPADSERLCPTSDALDELIQRSSAKSAVKQLRFSSFAEAKLLSEHV